MYVSEDTTCPVRQIMMVDDGAYHQVKKKNDAMTIFGLFHPPKWKWTSLLVVLEGK